MTEQSGRFLIFLIDFIAFNIRLSKSSFAIASSMVSVVMSFYIWNYHCEICIRQKNTREISIQRNIREKCLGNSSNWLKLATVNFKSVIWSFDWLMKANNHMILSNEKKIMMISPTKFLCSFYQVKTLTSVYVCYIYLQY